MIMRIGTIALVLGLGAAAYAQDHDTNAAVTTLTVQHLDLSEAAGMLRQMTGNEAIKADEQGKAIRMRDASTSVIDMAEMLLRVFDTEPPHDSPPLETRVFRLSHLPARDAVTLLRKQLSAKQVAMNPDRQRIAIRETHEKLEQAEKLLADADRSPS
jgi:type II secretory pathway component GspD/PulD (secretin)